LPLSHQTPTLFRSPLMTVVDYRCSGGRQRQEEWPTAHEIILPRYGLYQRRDAFGQTIADPNQILFSNRDQPYDISHPVSGEDRSTVILVEPATLLEIVTSFDDSVADHPDVPFPLASIPTAPRLHLSHYGLLNNKHSSYDDPIAVEEYLLTLLGEILAMVFAPDQTHPMPTLLGTVREHADLAHTVQLILNAHFREGLLLADIAAQAYSSPFHLSRVFKRQTGLTIHQYRQRLRLLHAAERIAEDPQENFDRLALDLGFANHSHFTTAFGKAFHTPPSDFRRSVTSRRLWGMSKILKV
jgi:AraC family transcriptional regulator